MSDRGTIEGGVFNTVVQFSFLPFFQQVMAETSYMFCQGDLPKLNLQIYRGTEFKAWWTQWSSFSSLSGLVNEDSTKQVKILTLCLSRETLDIMHNWGLSEEQMKQPDTVIQAMQEYIDGHVNKTVEHQTLGVADSCRVNL